MGRRLRGLRLVAGRLRNGRLVGVGDGVVVVVDDDDDHVGGDDVLVSILGLQWWVLVHW